MRSVLVLVACSLLACHAGPGSEAGPGSRSDASVPPDSMPRDGGADLSSADLAVGGESDLSSAPSPDLSSGGPDLGGGVVDLGGRDQAGLASLAFGRSIDSDFTSVENVSGVVATVGDFNGDGKPDLVVGTKGARQIVVLLGNGDGTFIQAGQQALGADPTGLAVGDFDHDGDLDVAAAGTAVSVLAGDGHGGLAAPATYDGVVAYGIATGDVNRDGALDLVVGNSDPDTNLGLLLGKGNGTFQTPMRLVDAGVNRPDLPALGDLNGDGKLDLAVGVNDEEQKLAGGIAILLGNGDGTFGTSRYYDIAQGPEINLLADLNHDGKLDVVTAFLSDNVVLPGNGDGTFGTAVQGDWFGHGFAIADFDLDGNPDIATGDYGNEIYVDRGAGDFSFTNAANPMIDDGPESIVAADVDGDGRTDLASVSDDAFGGYETSVVLNLSR